MGVPILKLRFLPALLLAASAASAQTPLHVTVDVTDAPRKLLHAALAIPVQSGPLTLLYPQWIPGEHGPTGPITDLAGIVIRANGTELAWRRDDVNMFALHLTVPEGISSLDVKLDFLATAPASGFTAGASTSASLAIVSWNELILYPSSHLISEISVQPAVRLPAGWQYGTALTKTSESNGTVEFEPVSLEQLIDSPLLAGKYFKEIPLAPEITPKHYLDLAADGPEDLRIKSDTLDAYSNLIRETGPLFQSRHYASYHFLVTLSDQVAHFGLEHHQSSDDRVSEKTFIDDNLTLLTADLLPHEFTHSWNGKYRRPAGLATGNYQDPMKGQLLWVYEGLTQYLGDVLAARSGLETPDEFRSALAASAATLDYRPGRTWRNLEDTAVAAQILYDTSQQWDNWRRSVDYYQEGELLWLEADTIIRKLTKDKKSLNDFCARFEGVGGNTPPKVVPYNFEDIIAALNAVVPYDWAGFFREHLTSKSPHAPLGGIENGGYKIVYTDRPSEFIQAREAATGDAQAWWTLGLVITTDGHLDDVLMGSVSDKAGLGPGMQIVAVNGRQYAASLLSDAITASKDTKDPIELIVVNTGYYKVVKIDYHDGLRFPHLERIPGTPAILDDIVKPMAQPPSKGKN
jgi:predicted metalloprotease with PDZ domain